MPAGGRNSAMQVRVITICTSLYAIGNVDTSLTYRRMRLDGYHAIEVCLPGIEGNTGEVSVVYNIKTKA